MIYLKTYFYTPTEINFINLNLMESYDKIDKFIVCEFNIQHNGEQREFIFEEYEHLINSEFKDKLIYLKCDLIKESLDAKNNEALAHKNETLMRGNFVKQMDFNDDDIIISVDADEIIYNTSYDTIIAETIKSGKVKVELNQFFYKLNYHWTNNKFVAPTSALYKDYKNKYPSDWRYDGRLLPGKHGCHFSWCMEVDKMVEKLNSYAHIKYKHLANKNLLEKAINNKRYPFDKRVFTINTIDRNSTIIPNQMRNEFFDEFWKKLT